MSLAAPLAAAGLILLAGCGSSTGHHADHCPIVEPIRTNSPGPTERCASPSTPTRYKCRVSPSQIGVNGSDWFRMKLVPSSAGAAPRVGVVGADGDAVHDVQE